MIVPSALSALLSLLPVSPGDYPEVPLPNNVVVIVADDVGVDMVGAYDSFYPGQPNPAYPNTTPAMDYMAATGLLFRNAWSCPLCSPTRAQIMSGRQPQRNGIGTITEDTSPVLSRPGLSRSVDTLAEILRQASPPYVSAAVGKWHLADADQLANGTPHPLGTVNDPWFDFYAGTLFNIGLPENYNGFTKTFATPIQGVPADECVPVGGQYCQSVVTTYATVDTADDAIFLIRNLPEPFFLYVAFNAAHVPLTQPNPSPGVVTCLGGAIQGVTTCTISGTDKKHDTRCMVTLLDNEIGRILCAIEGGSPSAPSLPTSTILIGDNGTAGAATATPFNNHHGKGTVFQGGVNVPLIIKSPWLSPQLIGTVHDALVCATDLFATVAALGQVTLAPDARRDSISLVPYLFGQAGSLRQYAYTERFNTGFVPNAQGKPPAGYTLEEHVRAIRDVSGYKLIQWVSNASGQLDFVESMYDLNADPFEATDLLTMPLSAAQLAGYNALANQLATTYPHLVR